MSSLIVSRERRHRRHIVDGLPWPLIGQGTIQRGDKDIILKNQQYEKPFIEGPFRP